MGHTGDLSPGPSSKRRQDGAPGHSSSRRTQGRAAAPLSSPGGNPRSDAAGTHGRSPLPGKPAGLAAGAAEAGSPSPGTSTQSRAEGGALQSEESGKYAEGWIAVAVTSVLFILAGFIGMLVYR